MKIKNLKISRYGKLKDFELSFSKSLNIIKKENEFGKSTIISAIKDAIYGFDIIKNHSYRPLDGDDIDFDLEIEHKSEKININRKLKTNSSAILEFKSKQERIKNIAIQNVLNEKQNKFIDDISFSSWAFTSEILAEFENFISKEETLDITGVQAFDYDGISMSSLLEKLEENSKKLYINRSNSNAKYQKIKREIIENRKKLEEIQKKEEELSSSYLKKKTEEKNIEIYNIKIKGLKDKIIKAKRFKELKVLRDELEYLNKIIERSNIAKEESISLYSDYRELINKTEEIKSEISRLEDEKKSISISNLPADVILIHHLQIESDRKYSHIFREIIEKSSEKSKLNLSLEILEKDINFKQRCIEDLEGLKLDLENLVLKLQKTKEEKSKTFEKYRHFLMLISIFSVGFSFLSGVETYAGIAFAVGSLLFAFFYYRSLSSYFKSKNNKISRLKSELKETINSLKAKSFEILDIEHLLKDEQNSLYNLNEKLTKLREYSSILIEFDKVKVFLYENIRNLESEAHEFSRLINSGNLLANLKDYFKVEAKMTELSTKEKFINSEIAKKEKDLNSNIIIIEEEKRKYEKLYGLSSIDEIQKLQNEENTSRERYEIINAKLRELGSSREEILKISDYIDIDSLEAELEEIILIKEESEKNLIVENTKLSHMSKYSVDNLREKNKRLNEALNKVKLDYAKVKMQIFIVEKASESIQDSMQPAYIEYANQYFSEITNNDNFEIKISSDRKLNFLHRESLAELDFKYLSSATFAQALLALKIAYLDFIDNDFNYPIIIDDAFMSYDSNRNLRVKNMIEGISKKRQVLLFTTS